MAREIGVEWGVGVARPQNGLLAVCVLARRVRAGIDHDEMVRRVPEAPEPFEQEAPAPARLLLSCKKGGALKARLEQMHENGGAYHIVQLASKTAVLHAQAIAISDGCSGLQMLQALRLEDQIMTVFANVALIDDA